ncbi:MAG: hypothetical protein GY777_14040 [Candidatus Brocadiaceae bacterium]|nr:hypothetical protein [Candidatus Brocadiaceae bacterium]
MRNEKSELKSSSSDGNWELIDAQIPVKTFINTTDEQRENITLEETKQPEVTTQTSEVQLSECTKQTSKNTTPNSQPKKEEIRSIRIDVEKLDSLFNIVGELVLSRNRIIQLHKVLSKRHPEDDIISLDLLEAGSQLNHLTSEIQWAVMKTRMIPVSTIFNKFHRIVRDMCALKYGIPKWLKISPVRA